MSITSWQGTMPNKAKEVAELQTRVSPLQDKHGFRQGQAFEAIIARLESLRDQIKDTEEYFYAQFNLPSGAQGLSELQKRLDEANSDIGFKSLSNVEDSKFDQLVSIGMAGVDLQRPVMLTFNQEPKSLEILSEPTIDNFIQFLEKQRFDKIEINNISTKTHRINRSSAGDRGLSKYIKKVASVEIDPAGKRVVSIELEQPLGQSWVKRLKHNYNAVLDTGISREEAIKIWLEREIKNPFLKHCVLEQYRLNIDKYDINSSPASVKGFLGEIRANAFLDYLCQCPGTSRPMGNIREIIKGRTAGEIPIDALFKGYGFQIKNYRILDGKVDFTTHNSKMSMTNFIIERVRPEAGIAKLLLQFYGSWAFNQPIEGVGGQEYQPIYNRFESKNLDSFFEGHIDNILRLSDEFQADVEEFAKPQLYYNTFFLISDKFVPSSVLLSAIIDNLKSAENNKYIEGRFDITPPTGGTPVWTPESWSTTEPLENLAARVKIGYSINLQIEKILETARNDIF